MTILESILKVNKPVGVGASGAVVRSIQSALLVAGHQLVPDGEYGGITEAAVMRFQVAHKLAALGFVGTKTAVALDDLLKPKDGTPIIIPDPLPSVLKIAPWVSQMRAITGTKEVPGAANSAIIMAWRSDIGRAFPKMAPYAATYTGDSIPWCGFGLAGCTARCNVPPPFGQTATDRFMWAAAWDGDVDWFKLDDPIPGCVMTFTRSGGGHVAILERLVGDFAYIRGCNQSDMVNVSKKSMSQFTAATWPRGWAIPSTPIAGDISNAVGAGSEA